MKGMQDRNYLLMEIVHISLREGEAVTGKRM